VSFLGRSSYPVATTEQGRGVRARGEVESVRCRDSDFRGDSSYGEATTSDKVFHSEA